MPQGEQFQRKSIKEKKIDNQLWLALDRFRNCKAEEEEMVDRQKERERNQKFLQGIN